MQANNTTTTGVVVGTVDTTSSSWPREVEDEISWVLHEFRKPQPQRRHASSSSSPNKQPPPSGRFSRVRCLPHSRCRETDDDEPTTLGEEAGPVVEVSYLFETVVVLTFRVCLRKTDSSSNNNNNKNVRSSGYTTTVVACQGPLLRRPNLPSSEDPWNEVLRERLRSICHHLNNHGTSGCPKPSSTTATNNNSSSSSSSSLFAVLSRLLLALDRLQAEVRTAAKAADDPSATTTLRPLAPRDKGWHLWKLLRRNHCQGGVDLAVLLWRCAALGTHAAVFCSPVPDGWNPKRDGASSSLARTVWGATEHHQRCCRQRPQQQQEAPKASSPPPSWLLRDAREQALLGFLHSLPWMQTGTITVKHPSNSRFEVCLHLDGDSNDAAASDVEYAPSFARACRTDTALTVYHGTHMENAWSILNRGFWNMSGGPSVGNNNNTQRFVKNGAMLGSGIYVTTSRRVAAFFATKHAKTQRLRRAYHHEALERVLLRSVSSQPPTNSNQNDVDEFLRTLQTHTPSQTSHNCNPDGGDQVSRLHDVYEVSCFPVFEARIAKPSTEPPQTHSRSTLRDGKYYVVPDGRDVRITKLHLTLDLTRKHPPWKDRRQTWRGVTNGMAVVLAVLGLALAVAARGWYPTGV